MLAPPLGGPPSPGGRVTRPDPPAHVYPYVEVLGTDLAIEFLLTFGGAELYMASAPKGRSRLVQLVGPGKAAELARAAGHLPRRVPTAKPWIAATWHARGLPVAEIARRLHVSDVSVRNWLSKARAAASADPRQLRLL